MASAEAIVAFTAPFALTWFLFLLLLIEHLVHRFNIKFQALCLRITIAFPFVSTINYLNAFVSLEVFTWLNVTTALAEGLLLLEFFALLVGWFWSRGGNVFEALVEAPQSNHRCWCRCLGSCGKRFTDGSEALTSLLVQVAQYAIVKPCTDVIEAIVYMVDISDAVQAQRILQTIDVISVILALRALLILYVVLRRCKDPVSKQSYFAGLSVVYKFILIKLLFAFVVLNNLILSVLSAFNAIDIPTWICAQNLTTEKPEDCTSLFKSFIFLVESACATLAALHFFRSKALCYPEVFGNFENYPGKESEDRSIVSLIRTTCRFWDLNTYIWPQEPPPLKDDQEKKYCGFEKPIEQQASEQLQQGHALPEPKLDSVSKA